MKLIDDKGRLFGRINLLDLAVIIGVLAALFVGVSAWIAIRQQPIALLELKPAQVTTGKPVNVTVKLQNERYIVSARLHLISDQPGAKTTTLNGQVRPSVRDQATFTVPADLPAGNYSVEIEARLMDVFNRQSLQTIRNNEIKLVVAEEVTIVEKPVFNSTCLWKLELNAVLLSGGDGPPELEAGNSLECRDGMILTLVKIERDLPAGIIDKLPGSQKENAFALATLEVTASFKHLKSLLTGLKSPISLSCRDTLFEAVALGDIIAELDLLFYLDDADQTGLLESGATLATRDGLATAVVVENFGQVDNPWLSAAAVTLGRNDSPAFSVARVRFTSRPKNSGLYFGTTRLEPDRLLTFQPGGSKIKGGILSTTQPNLSATVRVILDNIPTHLVPLLTNSVLVTNAKGNVNAGRIKRVLDIASLQILPTTPGGNRSGIGRDFRRLLLELDLDCTSSSGKLYFQGQQIDYGRNLNLALLGHQFAAIIYHGSSLPPHGKLVWEKIQVEFRRVPPEIVPWIRAGEREYLPNKPSPTWKIERVMSNEPTKVLYSGADGRLAHLADHPTHRDIRCQVSLQVTKIGDDLFYSGNRLKIGSSVSFNARRWSFSASLATF